MRSNKRERAAPAELYGSAAGRSQAGMICGCPIKKLSRSLALPTGVFAGQSANKDVYSGGIALPSIPSYSATLALIQQHARASVHPSTPHLSFAKQSVALPTRKNCSVPNAAITFPTVYIDATLCPNSISTDRSSAFKIDSARFRIFVSLFAYS